ncbi:MAG: Gfo/Idh/MocA family protein, partial [Bryobacteraceae bacterium]
TDASRIPAGIRGYPSYEDLLEDPETAAVVVATPSSSHRTLVIAALEAGKHVFVEKPLAGTLEDAAAIVAAAARAGRVAQAGFCERFNVNYLEAKRAVSSGALGRIRSIQTSRVAPFSFSDPAWDLGVLDTAVHNFDLTLWLTGKAPVSVLARGVQVYGENRIPHAVTTLLSFADGALATDHIAWLKDDAHPLHQCARSRMMLQGEAGSFSIDLTDRPSALLTAGGYRKLDTIIVGRPDYYGCLKLQFEAFLRSIEDGAKVLAPLEDALLTERVALAARDSLASGKEVRLS